MFRHQQLRLLAVPLAAMYFVLMLVFSGCSGGSSSSSLTTGTTTVLVYMEGSTLESEKSRATENIKEMLLSKSSPNVNVVLTTGAAGKTVATDPVTNWRTVKRHIIKNGSISELQDLGAVDMGKRGVLTDFITWGITTFPADKYILVFWDHGGGILLGYGGDYDTDTSRMSINELRQGIADAYTTTGKRFELIGFDACLMATAEVAASLSAYASYLVASEEIEPGAGWNYTPFLNALSSNPASDGLAIGRVIADAFSQKSAPNSDQYTISVVDLSQINALVSIINEFAILAADQLSQSGRTAWNLLASARCNADEFAADYVHRIFYNLTDIGQFSAQLADTSDVYRHISVRLQSTLSNTVRYIVNGAAHQNVSGLSFYFPFHLDSSEDWPELYDMVAFAPAYKDLLTTFVDYPKSNPPGKALHFSEPLLTETSLQATIESPFWLDEQFVTITQAQSGTVYTLLGIDMPSPSTSLGKDSFLISYNFENKWFSLDGHNVTVLFDGKVSDTTLTVSIPILYRPSGTGSDQNRPVNLRIKFDPIANNGVTGEAWEGAESGGLASRVQIKLKRGDIITPLFTTYDTETDSEEYSEGDSFAMVSKALVLSRTPIETPGMYNVSFFVRDLAGNEEISSSVSISLPTNRKQATKTSLNQPETIRKLPLYALQQGFWHRWNSTLTSNVNRH